MNLGSAVAVVDLDITGLISKTNQANSAMSSLGNNTPALGAMEGQLNAGGQAAESFAKRMDRLGESIGKAGKQMTTFVTLPIAAAYGIAFNGAADLESAQGKANAVFGDSIDIVTEFGATSAESFGMSERAYLDIASGYGALFNVMGMTSDESARLSTELVQVTADSAAFNNVSTDRASDAISAGLRGEYESLETLGIFLNEAIVSEEAMAIAVADGRSEITEADKVMARRNLILEQSTQQTGQFAAEQDTANGQMAIARARLEDAAAAFGQHLLPYGTAAIKLLSGLLEGFTNMSSGVQKAILVLTGIAAAIGPVLLGVSAVMKAIGPATTLFRGLSTAVGLLTSPIGLVVVGIALLAAGLIYAYTHFEGFRNVVNTVAGVLGDLAGNVIDLLISGFNRAVGVVQGLVSAFMGMDIVQGIVGYVRELIGILGEAAGLLDGIAGERTVSVTLEGDDKYIEWQEQPDGTTRYAVMSVSDDGTISEYGEVIDSYTDENDPNIAHILIEGDDGPYWTTVDKTTGEIGDATIEVQADTEDARSGLDRIKDALLFIADAADAKDMPILSAIAKGAIGAVTGIQKLSNWFGRLNPVVKEIIVGVGAFLLVLKPIIAVVGMVIGVFSPLISIITGVGSAIAFLISPVGLVIAGIALLAAGLIYAYGHFEGFRNAVDAVVGAVKSFWDAIASGEALQKLQQMATDVQTWLQDTADSIISGVRSAFDGIVSFVTGAISRIAGIVSGIWSGITSGVGAAWNAIQSGIQLAWNAITTLDWSMFIPSLDWAVWIVGKIGDFAGWIWEKIGGFFPSASLITDAIGAFTTWIWGKISGFFPAASLITDSIGAFTTWIWGKISSFFPAASLITDSIGAFTTWIWGKISSFFPSASLITDSIGAFTTWIWGKISSFFPSASLITDSIGAFTTWIWGKISGFFPAASLITDAIGAFTTWIWGKIGGFFPSSSLITNPIGDLGAWLYEKIGSPKVSIPAFPGWRTIADWIFGDGGTPDPTGSTSHPSDRGSASVIWRDTNPGGVAPGGSNYANPYNPTEGGNRFIETANLDGSAIRDWAAAIDVATLSTTNLNGQIVPLSTNVTTLDGNVLTLNTDFGTFNTTTIDTGTNLSTLGTSMTTAMLAIQVAAAGGLASTASAFTAAFLQMQTTVAGSLSSITSAMTTGMLMIQTTAAGGLASTASAFTAAYLQMQTTVAGSMSSITSAMTTGMLMVQTTAAGALSSTASAFTTGFTRIQTTVAGAMSSVTSAVRTGMTTVQTTVAGAMASAVSATTTGGSRMGTSLASGVSSGVSSVRSTLNQIPGIVNGVAGSGAAAAYNAGSAIGAGFANGMTAYLGQIRAAAAAMVAAAQAAVLARAMISSPSKLFRGFGEYVGEGFELGIRRMIPDVAQAANDMVAIPALNRPNYALTSMPGGRSRSSSVSYGDIIIYQQPGEDGEVLARRVISIIDRDYDSVNGMGA